MLEENYLEKAYICRQSRFEFSRNFTLDDKVNESDSKRGCVILQPNVPQKFVIVFTLSFPTFTKIEKSP